MKTIMHACILLAVLIATLVVSPSIQADDAIELDPNGMIDLGPSIESSEAPEFPMECGDAIPIDPSTGEPDSSCVLSDNGDEANVDGHDPLALIENATGYVVTGLYVKPSGTDDWTMNYLDDRDPLDVGEYWEIEMPGYLGDRCAIEVRYVMTMDDSDETSFPENTISVDVCEDDIVLKPIDK